MGTSEFMSLSIDWTATVSKLLGSLDIKLFEISGRPISVATLVTVFIVVSTTLVASRLLQGATLKAFRVRGTHREGTARAVARLVHYLTVLSGLGIAAETMGLSLSALFAAGAIFAIGLGFAMQSIAQNFVSGVILLLERSIKPGDIVEVNDSIVKVSRMGIRATIVETRDGENVIVPNSMLIQSAMKNYTLGNDRYRIRIPVGVVYSSDMNVVKKGLAAVAEEVSKRWGVQEEKPLVVMTGFGDNAVNFEIGVWTGDPWNWRMSVSELHEAVWWHFKDLGVVIAFPQLDVHLDEPALRALSSRTANKPVT